MLPDWLPNVHPLVVHFPIALLVTAAAADLVALAWRRAAWASTLAQALYPLGAAAALVAYLSGRQAGAAALVPGMAQPVMLSHWNWALATTVYFVAIAVLRLAFLRRALPEWGRLVIVAASVAGLFLLYHTGEQGGRLVFQHGVGVSAF